MDLLVVPDFLGRTLREEILAELASVGGAPAAVYGFGDRGAVHGTVRKVTRVAASAERIDEMFRRFRAATSQMEEFFGVTLTSCEEPQFLHYCAGDYFVAHQDGNVPLIRDDTRARRVSVVLFLNDRSTYGGGELTFHGEYPNWTERHVAPASAGTLVAFRSEMTHEVTPLTYGDRYTAVTWYR